MSADNGLIISKVESKYYVEEFVGGSTNWKKEFDTLETACMYAQKYANENTVEYGITFNL